ncbi:MAG: hypothetical protein JW901_05980 [Dehalococcoidia bacterium]|nr:hypothetical protein [Dehalococcoidia bacterium]
MSEQSYLIRQISVFLDNTVGSMARLAHYLSGKNINLRALSVAETRDFGAARLIVHDPDKCIQALKEEGYHFSETDVLVVEVPDRPGGMIRVLDTLNEEHINVEYIYSMVKGKEGMASVVLRASDPVKACAALKGSGVNLLTPEDVTLS